MSPYESTLNERKSRNYKFKKYLARLQLCRAVLLQAKPEEMNHEMITVEDIDLENDWLPEKLYKVHEKEREALLLERQKRWDLKRRQLVVVETCPFKALQAILKAYGGRYAMEVLRQELAKIAKRILEAIKLARGAQAPAITNS